MLLIGAVHALGDSMSAIQLIAVIGACQHAGALTGVHGASPRDGALVAGMASLGRVVDDRVRRTVALTALLYGIPALLVGGGCFLAHWLKPRWAAG